MSRVCCVWCRLCRRFGRHRKSSDVTRECESGSKMRCRFTCRCRCRCNGAMHTCSIHMITHMCMCVWYAHCAYAHVPWHMDRHFCDACDMHMCMHNVHVPRTDNANRKRRVKVQPLFHAGTVGKRPTPGAMPGATQEVTPVKHRSPERTARGENRTGRLANSTRGVNRCLYDTW